MTKLIKSVVLQKVKFHKLLLLIKVTCFLLLLVMESNDDWGNSEDERLMCESVYNFERELENEENENLWSDYEDEQILCDAVDTSEGQIKTTQSGNSDYLCSSNQPKRLVSTPINQVGSTAPQQVQSALNNAVRVITFNPALNSDILVAFRGLEDQIIDAITNRFTQNRGIRAYLTADVSYTQEHVDGVQQLE